MKTPRTVRNIAYSLVGIALSGASAFAITTEDLMALRAKAETGDGIAQHNLGLIYANPQESITDLVEAYAWLNLAADNGATGRSLLIVTRQMTPEEIADGKRRLDKIRTALAAKNASHTDALVTQAPKPKASESPVTGPISPSSDSPVSASPISAAPPVVDNSAQQEELKKLGAELAEAWKENDALKTAAAESAKQTTAATDALKAERDRLAAAQESATREIATMKAAAANFEGERNGLLQKISAAQKATDGELRMKMVALENDLAKAKAAAKELEAAKQSLAALGEQQQTLTAENQRLTGLATQAGVDAVNQASAAEKKLSGVQADLTKAQAALAEAKEKEAAQEKTVADLAAAQARIQTMESDLTRVAGEKKDLAAKLETATAKAISPAEIARMNSEIADLKDRLASSQQALAVANAETKSAQQELQTSKRSMVAMPEHQALQEKLIAATKAADQQKQAYDELKKSQDALMAEKEKLTAQIASAEAAATEEIGALKAGAANFEGERNGLMKKIAETEESLASARGEAETLKNQLAETKAANVPAARYHELEAQLATALAAGGDSDKARTELQQNVKTLESEKTELAGKLDALTNDSVKEIAELKAGAANFEGERNGLLQKIADAEKAQTQTGEENAALKKQLASARSDSTAAKQAAMDLANATAEAARWKKSATDSEQALAAATAEAAGLKQQLEAAKADTTASEQLQALQAQLASATQALEEEKQARAGLEKSVSSLETERDGLAGKIASAEAASTGEVATLKASAANFEGERNGLMQKIDEGRDALSRATEEIAALKQRIAATPEPVAPAKKLKDLQAKLTASEQAAQALKEEQAALQKTNADLDAERARLAQELAAAQSAASSAAQTASDELQAKLKAAEEAAVSAGAERETLTKRVAELEQQIAAAPTVAAGEDPVELRKQLDDASGKLAATLRSFQIKQDEIDLLQKSLASTDAERAALAQRIADAEQQAADAKTRAAAGEEASAQLAAMHEQLRNAQNQIGQLAAENIQLKNRDVAAAPAPSFGRVLSAPRRPADTTSPTTTPVRATQVAEPRIHTVVEGENLSRIARRYYGNSERWIDIYDANRASLPNPASLKIGMKLRIP